MSSFLKMVLAVILAQVILLAIVAVGLAGQFQSKVKVPKGAVLVQTLDGAIPESPSIGALPMPFGEGGETHTSILENLEKARYDKRIKAVVLRVGSPAIGFAKMDELRERIAQVRAAGKPVWAYTEVLYGRGLYLGSACDSLFLMPNGYVALHGVASERQFLKGTLEKLGIKQNLHRIEGYKSAAEMLQRDDMSPESRANMDWMLDEVYPHRIETIERSGGSIPARSRRTSSPRGRSSPPRRSRSGSSTASSTGTRSRAGCSPCPAFRPTTSRRTVSTRGRASSAAATTRALRARMPASRRRRRSRSCTRPA